MFSCCKYLIVYLVFSHLGFWSGNLFLIAPFPVRCLPAPFFKEILVLVNNTSCRSAQYIEAQRDPRDELVHILVLDLDLDLFVCS